MEQDLKERRCRLDGPVVVSCGECADCGHRGLVVERAVPLPRYSLGFRVQLGGSWSDEHRCPACGSWQYVSVSHQPRLREEFEREVARRIA